MKRIIQLILISLSWLMAFGGSAGAVVISAQRPEDIAYYAADTLYDHLCVPLDRTRSILYSSFVRLDDSEAVSPFGRLIGEQIGSRFSQYGYPVIDFRLRKNTLHLKKNQGELALSQDPAQLLLNYEAQAVITGVYAVAGDRLSISARLIKTGDHIILSSCEFSVWINPALQQLLGASAPADSSASPPARETIVTPPAKTGGPLAQGFILLQPTEPLAARIIQNRLSRLGYYAQEIHGRWDALTKDALKRFKQAQGLPGTETWNIEAQKQLFKDSGQ